MWKLLRAFNRDGAHFRKQAPIGKFAFDFGDLSARLLIELDGVVHRREEVALRDVEKEAWAVSQGFRVLRILNSEVWSAPDAVVDRIRTALRISSSEAVGSRSHRPPPPTPSPQGGGGRVRSCED
jgi:very-short-patch-repair endonuclease